MKPIEIDDSSASESHSEAQNEVQAASSRRGQIAALQKSASAKIRRQDGKVREKEIQKTPIQTQEHTESESSDAEIAAEAASSSAADGGRPRAIRSSTKLGGAQVEIVTTTKHKRGRANGIHNFKGMRKTTSRANPALGLTKQSYTKYGEDEHFVALRDGRKPEPVRATSSDSEDEILLTSPGKLDTASPRANSSGVIRRDSEAVSGSDLEGPWVKVSRPLPSTDSNPVSKVKQVRPTLAAEKHFQAERLAASDSSDTDTIANQLKRKSSPLASSTSSPETTTRVNAQHPRSAPGSYGDQEEEDDSTGLFEHAEDLIDSDFSAGAEDDASANKEVKGKPAKKSRHRALLPTSSTKKTKAPKIDKVQTTEMLLKVMADNPDIPVPDEAEGSRRSGENLAETVVESKFASTKASKRIISERKKGEQAQDVDIPVPGLDELQEDKDFLLPPPLTSEKIEPTATIHRRAGKVGNQVPEKQDPPLELESSTTGRPKVRIPNLCNILEIDDDSDGSDLQRVLGNIRKIAASDAMLLPTRRKRKSFSPGSGTSVRTTAVVSRVPQKRPRVSLADRFSSEDEDTIEVAKSLTLYNGDGTLKEKWQYSPSQADRETEEEREEEVQIGEGMQRELQPTKAITDQAYSHRLSDFNSDAERDAEKESDGDQMEISGQADLDNLADFGDRRDSEKEAAAMVTDESAATIPSTLGMPDRKSDTASSGDLAALEAQAQAEADPKTLAQAPHDEAAATNPDEVSFADPAGVPIMIEDEEKEDLMGQSSMQPAGVPNNAEDDRELAQSKRHPTREASEHAEKALDDVIAKVAQADGSARVAAHSPRPSNKKTSKRPESILQTARRQGEDSDSDDVPVVMKRSPERTDDLRSGSPPKKDKGKQIEKDSPSHDPAAIVSRTFGRGSKGTMAPRKSHPIVEIAVSPVLSARTKTTLLGRESNDPKTATATESISANSPNARASPSVVAVPPSTAPLLKEERNAKGKRRFYASESVHYEVEEPDEVRIIYDEIDITIVEMEEDGLDAMDSEDSRGSEAVSDGDNGTKAMPVEKQAHDDDMGTDADLTFPAEGASVMLAEAEAANGAVEKDAVEGEAPVLEVLEQINKAVTAATTATITDDTQSEPQQQEMGQNDLPTPLETDSASVKVDELSRPHAQEGDPVDFPSTLETSTSTFVEVIPAIQEIPSAGNSKVPDMERTTNEEASSDHIMNPSLATAIDAAVGEKTEAMMPETTDTMPDAPSEALELSQQELSQLDSSNDFEKQISETLTQGTPMAGSEDTGEEDAEGDVDDGDLAAEEKLFSLQSLLHWVTSLESQSRLSIVNGIVNVLRMSPLLRSGRIQLYWDKWHEGPLQ